jgi:hypothetical protein
MSTLSEHPGNGAPTKTSLQREETKEQIDGMLQQFDVLSSRFDRFIFKYISVYLLGLFFPSAMLLILLFLSISPQLQAQLGGVLLGGGLSASSVVVILTFIWLFNVWRSRTPKTLRDLLEQQHIAIPNSDATPSYLSFLEHYRNALASPKRYLLSGFPMICFSSLIVYATVHYLSVEHVPDFVAILGGVGTLLYALEVLGGLLVIGIVMWVMYISGWYVRKLVRTFEFSIQPFHPDQCGGLKLLGNFCFGLGSPLFLFSGFGIGFILLILSARGLGAVFLASNVGFSLLLLLYTLPVIVCAFLLPLWDIHVKMVSESETEENIYVARIRALREEIQSLLDTNQIEEAKAVQEKKALVETLYTPYPTWPFRVRSKIFSTVLGVSGSLLLGVITAALQQYIVTFLFHRP